LYAAQLLAEGGLRVAVYERQAALGETGRTWIVTSELNRVLGFVPSAAIVHQVEVMELLSHSRVNEVRLQVPDLIVERALMQLLLAERAQAAGVRLHLGYSLRRMHFEAEGVELEMASEGGAKRARVHTVIGADGVTSAVARLVGAQPQRAAPVVQARVRLPTGHDPRRVRVWFDRRRTRFFYWLIPESSEHGVVGLVAESPADARHRLDEFLVRQHLRPLQYQGALIPLHQPLRRIEWRRGAARVLLVGDAAAHVKVTTVGGLVSGLWGARAAAESLLTGTPYFRALWGLHQELYLHDLIRWALDRFDDDHYDHLLRALSLPLKRLLARRNRDSMSAAPWALVTAQPALLGLAAKAAWRPYRASPAKMPVKPRQQILNG